MRDGQHLYHVYLVEGSSPPRGRVARVSQWRGKSVERDLTSDTDTKLRLLRIAQQARRGSVMSGTPIEKLARAMTAWRYGSLLPPRIARWVVPVQDGFAVLISPRAGAAHGAGSRAGLVIEKGWWIIEADTGCLYAVPHTDFASKYRVTRDEEAAL